MEEVVEAINRNSINVKANILGDKLVLTDNSGGGGTFKVENAGATNTASSLGIAKSGSSNQIFGDSINFISLDTPLNLLNFSYAFILVVGLSLGYFVGNIIYHKPLQEDYSMGNRSSKTIKVNPVMPIAKNDTPGRAESFAIPVDEGMKKELNLYGGVILLETDAIKNKFLRCKDIHSLEIDLRPNDIVIEVNGNIINDQQSLEKNMRSDCNDIVFKIMREGKIIEKKYSFKIKKIKK